MDKGGDDSALGLASMGDGVAHKVDSAALPGGSQDLGHCLLDAELGVGDHQFDAVQAAAGQLAQESDPEGRRFGSADVQDLGN